jgi:hypothetical protein
MIDFNYWTDQRELLDRPTCRKRSSPDRHGIVMRDLLIL